MASLTKLGAGVAESDTVVSPPVSPPPDSEGGDEGAGDEEGCVEDMG
jgi:hypothetical protein